MKAIVISEDDFEKAFRLFLLELQVALKDRRPEDDVFRTVNYHAISLKDRLSK